jgi:predicted nucleic acid-binding protein
MYLLDTNVISELRKAKTDKIDKGVEKWAGSVPSSSLFLSAITILEIELGILQKERKDPVQGSILRAWVNDYLLPVFSERILFVDTAVAKRCAALHVPDPKPQRDSLIAATAIVHEMVVVTRNVRDFESAEVEVLNPWEWK